MKVINNSITNMKYLTYSSVLVLTLICLIVDGINGQLVEDDNQDELSIMPTSTQLPSSSQPTTTTTTTTIPTQPPVFKLNNPISKKKQKVTENSSKQAAYVCPTVPFGCNCDEKPKKLTCNNATTFPNLPSTDWNGLISIDMEGSSMSNVDLNQLIAFKDSLESLDLSRCKIETFSAPIISRNNKDLSFSKLKTLNLSNNNLQSIAKLSGWKFPALEDLDLSSNLALIELGQNDFNNTRSLLNLNLKNLQLKSVHEQTFQPISQLKTLNMTGTKMANHLGDKQFSGNQKLEIVDLTDNGLIEVPFALRSTNSIIKLILNSNNMTSLRQSDFINRTKMVELEIKACPKLSKIDDLTFSDLASLNRLILSDNPAMQTISKDAFKQSQPIGDDQMIRRFILDLLDIRNNNITTISNPTEFTSLSVKQLLLSGNPWHCDCNMKWFNQLSSQSRPLAHCKTPPSAMDMEIGEYLSTIDCEIVDSIMRTVIVTGFILFLFILTVLVFVQKHDICRRFLSKDQYGTIYYTKATFPPETV